MGRHKLPYKMKKPNPHHRYWRYVLSTDPKHCELSTRTKVKNEAERIAKEAFQKVLEKQAASVDFGSFTKDFFTSTCSFTRRKQLSNKPFSEDMLKVRRGHLVNFSPTSRTLHWIKSPSQRLKIGGSLFTSPTPPTTASP
jgi:hypothetical protein